MGMQPRTVRRQTGVLPEPGEAISHWDTPSCANRAWEVRSWQGFTCTGRDNEGPLTARCG